MEKFRNKYRIKSHRMPGWDYSGNGYYFITIVTQNRECNLGKIVKTTTTKTIFSDFGKIVVNEWYKSFEIRDELFLDESIIMPNHIHAIIVLEKNNETNGSHVVEIVDVVDVVETHGRASLQHQQHQQFQQRANRSFHYFFPKQ